MKKILLLTFIAVVSTVLSAQTEYDALRLTQTEVLGSARYISMGGAFGALGGDISALKDNPAGLGIFRKGEISFTLNTSRQKAVTSWLGNSETIKGKLDFKVDNFGYVMAMPLWKYKTEGFLQSNLYFSFNRLKNYNRVMRGSAINDISFTDFLANFTNGFVENDLTPEENPYNNPNIPWLSVLAYDGYLIDVDTSDPEKWVSAYDDEQVNLFSDLYESGSLNEFSFGWGGNFNNKLFVGANLNIWDIDYRLETILKEGFNQGDFKLRNKLKQTGSAINAKIGAIYLPTEHLRIGVSFHTPTILDIEELANADLDYYNSAYQDSNGEIAQGMTSVPERGSSQKFSVISGLQGQVSVAYLLGQKGLISAEYNFINYPNMELTEDDGKTGSFQIENDGMSSVMEYGHVFKVGAEAKITKNVAIRGGYIYQFPATNSNYKEGKALRLNTVNTNTEYFQQKNTNYYSFGIGYRTSDWYIDAGYMIKSQKDDFYPYQLDAQKSANVKSSTKNFVITLGLRI